MHPPWTLGRRSQPTGNGRVRRASSRIIPHNGLYIYCCSCCLSHVLSFPSLRTSRCVLCGVRVTSLDRLHYFLVLQDDLGVSPPRWSTRRECTIGMDALLLVASLDCADHDRYISLVAASCMVLYGYDASVFNALQNSKHWVAYYNTPGPNIIGAINTSYTVGAVVAGFFMGGPLADYAGRRVGMATGAVLVIIATFMQTFAARGQIGVFIAGRVLIGIGQGLSLSKSLHYVCARSGLTVLQLLAPSTSVNSPLLRSVERSCLSGRCSTRSVPSLRTGSASPPPSTQRASANGTGNWSSYSSC